MNKLVVLWKSDNLIDIEEMIVPYVIASKKNGWWKEVEVIIWGASQKLVSVNKDIQNNIKKMLKVGVKVFACKKCADDLAVTETLEKIGVNVMYTGVLLTEFLKDNNTKVITL